MNWLQEHFAESIAKDRCMRLGCTTCGALEFRRPYRNRPPDELASELARVVPPDLDRWAWTDPARIVIGGLLSIGEVDLDAALEGSWAGGVLRAMREHEQRRGLARAEEELRSEKRGAIAAARRQGEREAAAVHRHGSGEARSRRDARLQGLAGRPELERLEAIARDESVSLDYWPAAWGRLSEDRVALLSSTALESLIRRSLQRGSRSWRGLRDAQVRELDRRGAR